MTGLNKFSCTDGLVWISINYYHMMKPSNPKGTRDFLPLQMAKRSYIFDVIRSVFIKYGYDNIETPSFENLSTLTGKYGEEGDRLIFKILNSGDFKKNVDFNESSSELIPRICSRALRYDLTVPFARFVTQHRDKLTFPFKRYQIQPVWRADRPQKGRYREFYQCDADVVGSDSLLYEIEQVQILDEVLNKLKINHVIHLNNRKILTGIAEISGQKDKIIEITVALDKLDKIGVEGVKNELIKNGVSDQAIAKINPLFELQGDWRPKLERVKSILKDSTVGLKGIEELEFVLSNVEKLGVNQSNVNFDVTLARGLNYYTGAIFEVTTEVVKIGSICGGGRYDNLTELFGMSDTSGVGISFGADRIYDVLEEANLWPETLVKGIDIIFLNFGLNESLSCLTLLKSLRDNDFSGEIYPIDAKIKKQMKYANVKNISFVGIMGSDEIKQGVIKIKNMDTGREESIGLDKVLAYLSEQLN